MSQGARRMSSPFSILRAGFSSTRIGWSGSSSRLARTRARARDRRRWIHRDTGAAACGSARESEGADAGGRAPSAWWAARASWWGRELWPQDRIDEIVDRYPEVCGGCGHRFGDAEIVARLVRTLRTRSSSASRPTPDCVVANWSRCVGATCTSIVTIMSVPSSNDPMKWTPGGHYSVGALPGEGTVYMIVIGTDTHKHSHALLAVDDGTGRVPGTSRDRG